MADPSHRFLTDAEKLRVLAEWEATRACVSPTDDLADRGFPDPEMLPWCDRVNSLEGVCTLQSCSGHGPDAEGYRSSGHLWLRLDQERSEAFRARAPDLAKQDGIEKVSVVFSPLDHEVVEIYFRGEADNELAASMRTVLSFLKAL